MGDPGERPSPFRHFVVTALILPDPFLPSNGVSHAKGAFAVAIAYLGIIRAVLNSSMCWFPSRQSCMPLGEVKRLQKRGIASC